MKINLFTRADSGEHPQLRAFHQLYALYEGLPDSVLAHPDNRRAVAALEALLKQAEEKLKTPGDEGHSFISAELQRMEAALVRLLPPEELIPRLDIYRDEFHNLCTEETFAAYQASAGYRKSLKAVEDPRLARYLRSDALFLLAQLQRYNSLHQRAETSRTELLGRLARYTVTAIAVLVFPVLLFIGDRVDGADSHFVFVEVSGIATEATNHLAGLALITMCALAGVVGAFISATNRIQRLSVSRELARNAVVLKNTAAQLRWVPVTGIVSAILFALLVWSGLLQGDFFPEPFAAAIPPDPDAADASVKAANAVKGAAAAAPLTSVLFTGSFAKLMVWCFLAGFSERLVPDMLDRIIPRAQQAAGPAPGTPGAGQPQGQGQQGPAQQAQTQAQQDAAPPVVVDTTNLRAVVPPAPAEQPSADHVESDVVQSEQGAAPTPETSLPGEQTGTNDTPDPDEPTADVEIGLVDAPAEQPDAVKAEQPG